MKTLFTTFFNVSVICTFLILLVVVLRLLFHKGSKKVYVFLWTLVFLRLIIPVQLHSPVSLRPEMPALQKESTAFFSESEIVKNTELPDFIPKVKAYTGVSKSYFRIDYVMIGSWFWLCGLLAFVIYIIISYIRLKISMREAIHIDENVYESYRYNTAFLFGYFRPKIILPIGLGENTRSLIVQHERMHWRMGHNWLKLLCFVAVSVHWYNPFVWVAYAMLCKDIEYACDELVVSHLSGEEKKNYCNALLQCSRKYSMRMPCPVAFSESNIRGRIRHALYYKKPSVWITSLVIAIVTLFAVFFVTDPAPKYPDYYKELISLVGQPKDVVTEQLGITLGHELAPNTGVYSTPLKVNFEGVDFDLQLGFSVADDCLWSFRYIGQYENNKEAAARDTVKITRRLLRTYGTAEQQINKRTLLLTEINEVSVLDKFENKWLEHEGIDNISGRWNLTDKLKSHTHEYWDTLMNSEKWKNMWGGRDISLVFNLILSAWCEPDTNHCYLILEYETGYGSAN